MQEVAYSSPPALERGGRSPRDEHVARKTELEREAAGLGRISRWISTLRLVSFLGAAAIFFARGFGYLPWWFSWIGGLLGVSFVALVIWHARLDASERRVRAAIDFHKWAVERIEGRFESYPSRGDRFLSDAHPFTSDLGIFGPSSIFQLIDVTHTRRGEECLARWLAEPASTSAVLERQEAVRELRSKEKMREELFVFGALIAADKPNPDPLIAWAEGSESVPIARAVAFVLPAITMGLIALGAFGLVPSNAWIVPLVAQWAYGFGLLPKIEPIAAAVSSREGALARYRSMLEEIERQSFDAPLLRSLKDDVARGEARPASAEVRSLSTIVGFLDARRNEAFRFFIGPLLLWDAHCVVALETWRRRAGKNVRRWLEVIGEFEALASLAGFAYDHPEHAWPTLSETPAFRAKGLGHPILVPESLVRNDVELRGPGTALLVTGSNMSGKSTLLRSMGVNAVLAMAGAPVVAEQLVISVFEVRTSMWARDSLARGVSHFYAELEKLKRVVDGIRGDRPLFFLLDEILQGTNSRERVIGARSVLRHLLEHGAMGAVSTHDVGLLDLPPALDAKLDKVHFEEQVQTEEKGSAMSFDYKLRPGVVRSTNALRLMKLVGIDVDLE
jgi:predicted ATPase